MSKCCFDYFSLTQFILVKDVQMSSSCDYCAKQKKFYVILNKFNKYSEYVHLKKSCLLFFDFLIMNVTQLLKTYEKIEKKQITLSDEKQHLFKAFQAAETKKHQLHHHTQFLHNHDDKLIQKSAEVFKEELYVLKRKQNFAAFLNDSFSDLLISVVNVNTIFFMLSDDF